MTHRHNGHPCPRCGQAHPPAPGDPAPTPDAHERTPFRGARLVQVLEVATKEGLGTDDDPVRLVVRYVSPAGGVLAVFDPLVDERRVRP